MLAIIGKTNEGNYEVINSENSTVTDYTANKLLEMAENEKIQGVRNGQIMDMYELDWRFDFDPSLKIITDLYNKEYDKDYIKTEFKYLQNIDNFINEMNISPELFSSKDAEYIDYVNIAFKHDNKYDFVQLWRTDKGDIQFDCTGDDCPLTKDGKTEFIPDTMPDMTRIVEDGYTCYDYRLGDKGITYSEIKAELNTFIDDMKKDEGIYEFCEKDIDRVGHVSLGASYESTENLGYKLTDEYENVDNMYIFNLFLDDQYIQIDGIFFRTENGDFIEKDTDKTMEMDDLTTYIASEWNKTVFEIYKNETERKSQNINELER